MSLYDAPNLSAGIDDALITTQASVPIFIPMFLLFVFCVIFIGGIVNQKRRTGSSDVPMWATMASMGTLLVSLVLTLREGLIQIQVLSVIVVITIFSALWLFLNHNRNEV